MATAMGVHDYDDQMPNVQKHALEERLRQARAYLHALDKLSVVGMTMDDRLDYRLARSATQMEIARYEQVRPHERQPAAAIQSALTALSLLMTRDFAPLNVRAESLHRRLQAVPLYLLQARETLGRTSPVFLETALEMASGAETFFSETLRAFVETLPDASLREDVLDANRDAKQAMDGYARFLLQELSTKADADFALGKEWFDYLLRVGAFMEETSDDLREIGHQEIAAAHKELKRLAAEITPAQTWQEIVETLKGEHPAAGELTAAYAAEMERARQFVIDQRLVEMPADESLTVTETPAYQHSLYPYAAYVPPAPFEAHQAGVFWVTPVGTNQAETLLRGHSRYNLPVIALHEAYPGHHLQFSRAHQHPSRFRRHFADSNLFIEGWALYCEEMMYEKGFYTDPRVRLMQVKNQLWRSCRVVIDVELHTGRMSIADAVRFLVEEALLESVHAAAEVRRYCQSPTQPMTYVLGKRAILNLRETMEKRRGVAFDLARFHNELLSYGAVPPRLIREAMLSA